MSPDVIVIGAGTNGLTAAHLLARAGRKVVVLEQNSEPLASVDYGWVAPAIRTDLDLLKHGLVCEEPDPWLTVSLESGERLEMYRDVARTAEALRRFSPKDAAKWPEFCERMRRIAGVLEDLYTQPAPDVETTKPGELFRLALLGLKVRRLGRQSVVDLLRILPMSAAELLDEWFEHEGLKAALASVAVTNLCQGPRSGGTAFSLLHHHVGMPAGVFHPEFTNLGRVLESLPGIEVRRGTAVERIAVAAGRVAGVVLKGGETIAASVVVSNADTGRTMLHLVEPGWLDPDYVRAVRNIKSRGIAAQVTLHTTRPAGFTQLTLAPSMTYLERAYDDAKYGRTSANPMLDAHAQPDRVVVRVQYVPHTDSDWSDARRGAFGQDVAKRISAAAPELAGAITQVEVRTPSDLVTTGLTGGHHYHGELTLDQILFMRPVPGWSRYRTPIAGLYLCSAANHPGGAVAGGAGRLAAREIRSDE